VRRAAAHRSRPARGAGDRGLARPAHGAGAGGPTAGGGAWRRGPADGLPGGSGPRPADWLRPRRVRPPPSGATTAQTPAGGLIAARGPGDPDAPRAPVLGAFARGLTGFSRPCDRKLVDPCGPHWAQSTLLAIVPRLAPGSKLPGARVVGRRR